MGWIGHGRERLPKQCLNGCDRDAMALAFIAVRRVPIEAGDTNDIIRMHICTSNCQY
jgi:hypothetical protein